MDDSLLQADNISLDLWLEIQKNPSQAQRFFGFSTLFGMSSYFVDPGELIGESWYC